MLYVWRLFLFPNSGMRLEGDREEQMAGKENQDAIEGGNGGCRHKQQLLATATLLPFSSKPFPTHLDFIFSCYKVT